jgi:mono/diheme cytochrome c family protein
MSKFSIKQLQILSFVGLVGFLSVGCEPAEEVDDPEPVEEEEAALAEDPDFELDGDPEAGAEIYSAHCASCHGADGDGQGPAGARLEPPPTDFTTAEMSPYRAYVVTRDGGPAAGMAATMAPFGAQLDDQQLHDVTAYILEFGE